MFKIYKFGGSILKNADDVKLIVSIIEKENNINIFSAFNGITDAFIKLAKISQSGLKEYEMQLEFIETFHISICKELEIEYDFIELIFLDIQKLLNAVFEIKDLSLQTLDNIISYGEVLSSKIFYNYMLKNQNKNINFIDAGELIKTDSSFGKANVDLELTTKLVKKYFNENNSYIIPGFISRDKNGNRTTLGRNGSDYSASLLGAILEVNEVIIWKDVDGVFTTNPKIVKKAIQIDKISYKEMAELSYFGSKVLSINAIQPAIEKNINIVIRNLYNIKNNGTIISKDTNELLKIKGISKIDDIVLVSINGFGMVGISGFSKRVFSALHLANVNIVFISQSSSEISICVGIKLEDLNSAKQSINKEFNSEIQQNFINISVKENQSLISVAGYGMANTPGISAKIFTNISKGAISIVAIAQDFSEMNISFSVNSEDGILAVRLLHNSIFENKQINCLIAGKGVIGSGVIKMIESQKQHFMNRGNDINILGIFTSKIYYDNVNKTEMPYTDYDDIIAKFKQNADMNYVLIDCTSSDDLVENYSKFIENKFNIITPNKKANTLDFEKLEKLKDNFKKYNKHFFYEANVGAGLPIISTIKDLIDCGDRVIKIEGIFSGTLSYIFNNLTLNKKFSDIVLEAKEKGYTEPNPKDDLSGSDVGRKLLILARMIGYKINLADIKIQNLVDLNDEDIENMLKRAKENNSVLRYVGMISNNQCSAEIQIISNDNPLASIQETDNIISITTKYYNKTPLVIKGPGAGADVTSIGVVSDLIKLSTLL